MCHALYETTDNEGAGKLLVTFRSVRHASPTGQHEQCMHHDATKVATETMWQCHGRIKRAELENERDWTCQTTWSWCIKETRRVSRQTSHQEHNVESRHGFASQDSSRTWSVTCIFRRPSAVYLVSTTGTTAPLRGFRPDPGERLRRADFAASAAALLLI